MNPLRELALPPDPATRATAWVRAEEAGDDVALVALRELEQATAGIPWIIDGARRTRMLAADAIATTWEAWRIEDGQRVLLRCLQPRWLGDPVMTRRFALGAQRAHGIAAPIGPHPGPAPKPRLQTRLDHDWPHLRLNCAGAPVVDLLPIEDPPATQNLARLLGAGLAVLRSLHRAGWVHGGPIGPLLMDGTTGAHLVWMDGLAPRRTPQDDLRALALVIATLDPEGLDPVGLLSRDWIRTPPPSAADGLSLLQTTLARELLDQRHSLALAKRRLGRRDRATRLASAVRALATAVSPPATSACLHVDSQGIATVVVCDGFSVRGGLATRPDPAPLPLIWTRKSGLAPQAARRLLRAWASRAQGDEDSRLRHQAQLGGDDTQAAMLMGWLRSTAALRRAHLLLRHQARPRRLAARLSPAPP